MQTLGSWKHAPLAYVVAELRLGSILNLDPFAASLQDALGARFPRLVRGQEFGFVFDPQGMRQQVTQRFHFLTGEADACVVLTGDVLALHVTRYSDSDAFTSLFAEVLAALAQVREHQFVERIGLRYWDIVRAEGGLDVADFFAAPLSGLLAPLHGARLARDVHELMYEVSGPPPHVAVARLSLTAPASQPQPPSLMLVPELAPSSRLQSTRDLMAQDAAAKVGYVDIDVAAEIKSVLDVAMLVGVTKSLHTTQSTLFRQLTSPNGQAYWQDGEEQR
ncbi:TIGR04255 family protein [Cupriavidus sp. amp6]|uniref:TIGR04255 family protein n=1 Tax=Cupriavidus sp. amp6 TaxID=388051 RepID=UPI00048F6B10|nr:TIGR04255 family protein [Cupriavidus sp. amp6]